MPTLVCIVGESVAVWQVMQPALLAAAAAGVCIAGAGGNGVVRARFRSRRHGTPIAATARISAKDEAMIAFGTIGHSICQDHVDENRIEKVAA